MILLFGLRRAAAGALAAVVCLVGCAELTAKNIDELVIQDSTYYHPRTMEAYTGPVFKLFDSDPGQVQLRARLEDGTFNGELVVYHLGGRVRFEGEMADGRQCGGWLEDDDDSDPASEAEEVRRMLESIVLYPACP